MRVDIHVLGNNARHRAQSAGNTHGADIGVGWQRAVKHARIEFVGLTIDVEIGARKIRFQDGRADFRCRSKEFIDEMILGTANFMRAQPR